MFVEILARGWASGTHTISLTHKPCLWDGSNSHFKEEEASERSSYFSSVRPLISSWCESRTSFSDSKSFGYSFLYHADFPRVDPKGLNWGSNKSNQKHGHVWEMLRWRGLPDFVSGCGEWGKGLGWLPAVGKTREEVEMLIWGQGIVVGGGGG